MTTRPAFVADATIVTNVRSYVAETQHGAVHVNRWKKVLVGLGVESYAGVTAMTSTEAQTYADFWAGRVGAPLSMNSRGRR